MFSFTPFPQLETEYLLLRQLTEKDVEFIYTLRSDETVNKFLNRKKCTSIEEASAFIQLITENIAANKSLYWLINLKNENKPVGTITLWQFSIEENCAELGYELLPQYHGKGIMHEAIEKVIAYAFNNIGFQKLYGWSHKDNIASFKLLEKNSFKRDFEAEKKHAGSDELKNMLIYSRSNNTQ